MNHRAAAGLGILMLAGGLCFAGVNDWTGDRVDPVTYLSADLVDTLSLRLKWYAPTAENYYGVYGDGPYGNGTFPAEGCELRQSTTAISGPFNWDAMTKAAADVPEPGRPGELQTASVQGLSQGTTYWFLLRVWFHDAEDFSAVIQVRTLTDSMAPASISDLSAAALSEQSVLLQWTATGDDGTYGLPVMTELRYSATGPITTGSDFDSATPVPLMPWPDAPGKVQAKTVDGLASTTTYWFAIRSVDEVGNKGTLFTTSATATTDAASPHSEKGGFCAAQGAGGSGGGLILLTILAVVLRVVAPRRRGRASLIGTAAILIVSAVAIASVVGAPVEISPMWREETWGPRPVSSLAICYNSTDDEYLVAYWSESGNRIEGRRVTPKGDLVAGLPRVLTSGGDIVNWESEIAIAYAPVAGGRYMIACHATNTVPSLFFEILDHTLDPINGWVGAHGQWYHAPAIACDGNAFLAISEDSDDDWTNEAFPHYIRGASIDALTGIPALQFRIDDPIGSASRPSIAYLGGSANQYLVAWTATAKVGDPGFVRCCTVATNGAIGPIYTVSGGNGHANNDWPRVAANLADQEWMVVWEKNDQPGSWAGQEATMGTVAFRRVYPLGESFQPETLLGPADGAAFAPAVAWSAPGDRYVIHWQEGHLVWGSLPVIRGALLDAATGAIIESNIPISGSVGAARYAPVLAAGSAAGETLSAWGTTNFNFAVGYEAASFSPPAIPSPTPSSSPTPTPEAVDAPRSPGGGCGASASGASLGLTLLAIAGLCPRMR